MRFAAYGSEFCSDEECCRNDIDSVHMQEWLQDEVPLLECPDGKIEKICYFRRWGAESISRARRKPLW